MAGRSPARFLAPIALVGFAIALVAVIGSSSTDSESNSSGTTVERSREGRRARPTRTPTREPQRPATYTIKPGDTPSGIAAAHGITVGELLDLNPDVDPANLKVGAKLRLR